MLSDAIRAAGVADGAFKAPHCGVRGLISRAEEVVVVIFFVMTFNSRFIFRPSDFCEDWTEAQRIAASLLDSKSYETLVDFDNHLDDIRNDWTNPEINKAVLHLC